MSGTNDAKTVRPSIIRRKDPLRWRVVAFVAAVGFGALGIAWIDTGIWQSMRGLERGFAAVRTERFYQGVHMRMGIRQLNEYLMNYHLNGEKENLVQFFAEAQGLREWISQRKGEADTPEHQAVFEQLQSAFEDYLSETAELQQRPGWFGASRRQLDEIHANLKSISSVFTELCEKLVEIQRREFGAFLSASQHRLDSFQYLIEVSVYLLILLAVSVVVLVYRGMVMPLRLQLSESQATIARQEKLAALGTLAAGVAHEIRNPLTAIKFRLFSLKKSLPSVLANSEDTRVIDGEIQRLERIVKDFIQFARPSEPELVQVPAARMMEEVRSLFDAPLQEAAIQFHVQTRDDIWLQVDPNHLKQVLINLVRNAMESIEQGGAITLRVRKGQALLDGQRRPVAMIEVIDTGKGIPPEARQRLFDPFFTTKEGGTGLGLSIAARIVEKLGGELQYETEVNRGTSFRIILPRVMDHESQDSPR